MNKPYSKDIARVYDLLVEGREDAEADGVEMEFLTWALGRACPREVNDVLDAGCGTGRHLIPLVRQGYRVTGLDRSQGMVDECLRKLHRRGLAADVRQQDLAGLQGEQSFDAVLCMNSVICYLQETEKIVAALASFRRLLRPGGILVLDSFNFLAQWGVWGVPCAATRESDNVRIEYRERHGYDDFVSLYHIELDATVHEGGETWQIHNEDVLRAMTAGETVAYLKEAGLTGISAYPSFDRSLWSEPCGERMIFLAHSTA